MTRSAVYAVLAACVLAEVGRELLFKAAADRGEATGGVYALGVARSPQTWIGIALWAAELVGWIVVLQHLPLSRAFPAMTLVYAAVPMAGVLLLRERLTRGQVIGILLLVAGVLTISLGEFTA